MVGVSTIRAARQGLPAGRTYRKAADHSPVKQWRVGAQNPTIIATLLDYERRELQGTEHSPVSPEVYTGSEQFSTVRHRVVAPDVASSSVP